ncbi:MAG: outer membrane beta-barrel protein [Bacteroidetes bacterium]|nr:outer membrane beta-barrel protein [Bacteroidota bacterium]
MTRPILPILLMFASMQLLAQDKKFSLGFVANPNLGWISGIDLNTESTDKVEISNEGARLGFSYGLVGEYHFTPNYNLALGVNHLFTGGKFSGVNTGGLPEPTASNPISYSSISYEPAKLSYIHVPILIRLKSNEIGYMKYFGNIGFAFDFSLNGKASAYYDGIEYVDETGLLQPFTRRTFTTDVRFQQRFISPYFVVGLGGQYSLGGNTAIHIGIDYNNGLGNVISNKEVTKYGSILENARFTNSYVSVNLGIFL